jgi:hypothetical protein
MVVIAVFPALAGGADATGHPSETASAYSSQSAVAIFRRLDLSRGSADFAVSFMTITFPSWSIAGQGDQ